MNDGFMKVLVNMPNCNDHPLLVIEVTANTNKTAFEDITKDLLRALERAKRKVRIANKRRNHGWDGVHFKSYSTENIVNSEVLRTITDTTKYQVLAFGYGDDLKRRYKEDIDFEFMVHAPCIYLASMKLGYRLDRFEGGVATTLGLKKGKVIYPKEYFEDDEE